MLSVSFFTAPWNVEITSAFPPCLSYTLEVCCRLVNCLSKYPDLDILFLATALRWSLAQAGLLQLRTSVDKQDWHHVRYVCDPWRHESVWLRAGPCGPCGRWSIAVAASLWSLSVRSDWRWKAATWTGEAWWSWSKRGQGKSTNLCIIHPHPYTLWCQPF